MSIFVIKGKTRRGERELNFTTHHYEKLPHPMCTIVTFLSEGKKVRLNVVDNCVEDGELEIDDCHACFVTVDGNTVDTIRHDEDAYQKANAEAEEVEIAS